MDEFTFDLIQAGHIPQYENLAGATLLNFSVTPANVFRELQTAVCFGTAALAQAYIGIERDSKVYYVALPENGAGNATRFSTMDNKIILKTGDRIVMGDIIATSTVTGFISYIEFNAKPFSIKKVRRG